MKEQRELTRTEVKAWWLYKTKNLIIANVERIKDEDKLAEILYYVQSKCKK